LRLGENPTRLQSQLTVITPQPHRLAGIIIAVGGSTAFQIEALEFLGVVECLAHRIGQRGMLMENLKVQLVRPPVTVGVCAGPPDQFGPRRQCLSILKPNPQVTSLPGF
jgi:hypothetical protein